MSLIMQVDMLMPLALAHTFSFFRTHRQTDRQTERQIDRYIEEDCDKWRHTDKEIRTHEQTERQTNKKKGKTK